MREVRLFVTLERGAVTKRDMSGLLGACAVLRLDGNDVCALRESLLLQ